MLQAIAALAMLTGVQITVPGCAPGQSPQFVFGFAVLRERVGPVMGDPTTCEYADPNGTGDVLQKTTTGLAFWRKSTNTPTFTTGVGHFALTPASPLTVVYWDGPSIDPPPNAAPPQGAAEYRCDIDAIRDDPDFFGVSCPPR